MQAKENQLYKCTVMKLLKLFSHCYKLLKFQKARFTGKCISISCILSVLKFNDPYRLWGRFWVQTVWLAWGFCLYTTPPCSQEFLAFHINHMSHLYSQQRCDRSPISSVKCKYTYHTVSLKSGLKANNIMLQSLSVNMETKCWNRNNLWNLVQAESLQMKLSS